MPLIETINNGSLFEALSSYWLKCGAILFIGFGVASVFRKWSPAQKRLLWSSLLLTLLIIPALEKVVPEWKTVPIFSHSPTAITSSPTKAVENFVAFSSHYSWREGIVFVWGIGVCSLLLYMKIGRIGLLFIERKMHYAQKPAQQCLQKLKNKLRIKKEVKLLVSEKVNSPVMWGIFTPKIALPAHSFTWHEEKLELVLAHELAHIKQKDTIVQFFGKLSVVFNWFNPLAWIAYKRLQQESEQACDDSVLLYSGENSKPSHYASLLLEFARFNTFYKTSLHSGVITMAQPNQIERRIEMIVNKNRIRKTVGRLFQVTVPVLILGSVIPIVALAQDKKGPSQTEAKIREQIEQLRKENPEAMKVLEKQEHLIRTHLASLPNKPQTDTAQKEERERARQKFPASLKEDLDKHKKVYRELNRLKEKLELAGGVRRDSDRKKEAQEIDERRNLAR